MTTYFKFLFLSVGLKINYLHLCDMYRKTKLIALYVRTPKPRHSRFTVDTMTLPGVPESEIFVWKLQNYGRDMTAWRSSAAKCQRSIPERKLFLDVLVFKEIKAPQM